MNDKQPFLVVLFWKLWHKFATREIVTYVVAGVLTTVVNLLVFHLMCDILAMDVLPGNIIAWFAAVAFAYVINAFWVFRSKFESAKSETVKIVKFFGARVATLLVEEGGLLVFVEWLGISKWPVKFGLAVAVIILNFVFSKAFVFTQARSTDARKKRSG